MIALTFNFEIWCNVRYMQDSSKVIFTFFVPTANFLLFSAMFQCISLLSTKKIEQPSKLKIQDMCSQYFMPVIQLIQGKNNDQV